MPKEAAYGVPGEVQVVLPPSPMSHTILVARAVMVTVTAPDDADELIGPQVLALTAVHSHTGRPTRPAPLGAGARPMSAPLRVIFARAWRANSSGLGPPPAGGVGYQAAGEVAMMPSLTPQVLTYQPPLVCGSPGGAGTCW